jgi:hypothetical protein
MCGVILEQETESNAYCDAQDFIKLVMLLSDVGRAPLSWEAKHDIIFSDAILDKFQALLINFDWDVDETLSYEMRVKSILISLNKKATELTVFCYNHEQKIK